MLPVPWIGTGTEEATHSANPSRGQGILRGRPAATQHLVVEVGDDGGRRQRSARLESRAQEECHPAQWVLAAGGTWALV